PSRSHVNTARNAMPRNTRATRTRRPCGNWRLIPRPPLRPASSAPRGAFLPESWREARLKPFSGHRAVGIEPRGCGRCFHLRCMLDIPRGEQGMMRTAMMRTAVLAALWLALARQVPAVTEGGVLREPAQRVLTALGGDPERVLMVAAATRPAPDGAAMADLKREAQGVARRLERV